MPSQVDRTWRKRTTENRQAQVVSRNDDGSYDVQDLRTQQTYRCAKANPADEFTAGTRVIVSMVAASGLAIGAGSTIISRAPQEQRGVGLVARLSDQSFFSPVVMSLDPSPVRIEIGSATPQPLEVYGVQLTTAPTYGSADITNDSAPVVASTGITLSLVAATGTPGMYSVTCHGVTFSAAIELYSPPATPEPVWLSGVSGGKPALCTFDFATNAISGVVTGASAANESGSRYIIAIGGVATTIVRDSVSADARLLSSDGTDSGIICKIAAANLAHNGSAFVIASSDAGGKLYTVAADGTGLTTIATIAGTWRACCWDGTNYWIGGDGALKRIEPDGTPTDVTGFAGNCTVLAYDPVTGYVYANTDNADGVPAESILQIDIATVAIVQTAEILTVPTTNFVVTTDYVWYGTSANLNGLNIPYWTIGMSSGAILGIVALGLGTGCLYVVSSVSPFYVYRLDLATLGFGSAATVPASFTAAGVLGQ